MQQQIFQQTGIYLLKIKRSDQIHSFYKLFMGCEASIQADFNEPLDQELEQELNFRSFNKKGQEVDRFEGNKPQQGFVIFETTQDSTLFQAEQQNEQQFMAVKPWIGALVKPTNPPPVQNQQPPKNLQLQFVNGFTVQDSRQNMFWSHNKDEIIYPAAALGIVMNVSSLKQRFMGTGVNKQANGHTDNVLTLGVDHSRKRVVTGSLGARPSIIVWDADTMQIISRTNLGRNTRAVSSLRFSRDGKLFFCSDKHNDSNVYCFETQTGQLLGTNKCGADPVFDGQAGDNDTFAVATKRGIWFFQGPAMQKKKGIFNGNEMAAMITITYDEDAKAFCSGTANGSIYFWAGPSCTKTLKLHEGAVMGLAYASGKLLSSGSKDNLIKISKDGQVLKEFKIEGYAKSLDLNNGILLVGTKFGEILTINQQTGAVKQVMRGHWTGETWGLAIGSDKKVYTTADDNTIVCFNPSTNKTEKTGVISQKQGKIKKIGGASTLSLLAPNKHSRAIAVSKSGHVAIGTNEGELSIRTTSDLNTAIFFEKISKQWIEVIKYSPDESMLAVGSHDNDIYIFKVNGNSYTFHGKLQAHKSFITNMDWSRDGKYIQSNCGAYELLFFDVLSKKQLKSGATQLRDEKWATYTCKLGWWVQGIFPPATSGDHVNGVDRNHSQDIIATGDDWGFVNLYGNPTTKGAKCKAHRGHSSHVVRVMFDQTDSYLYSIGGYDKTLMKWKVC